MSTKRNRNSPAFQPPRSVRTRKRESRESDDSRVLEPQIIHENEEIEGGEILENVVASAHESSSAEEEENQYFRIQY